MKFSISDSSFISRGTRCSGKLYLPDSGDMFPAIIMAHGFAAEASFCLPAFAERFAGEGMAVFLFDYRNFGESDGEPRNLVSHYRHIQDWSAAISHARSLPEIDKNSIALWGTSFSGGHVIVSAASDPGIAAIVSQVPFVDALSSISLLGVKYIMQATFAGLRDIFRMITFRRPYYVSVVSEPGKFAVMNRLDSKEGYLAIVPDGSSWENRCPARVLLSMIYYRPGKKAKSVKCPALIIMAENDSLIPASAVERTASIMGATLVSMPVGHFDVYHGNTFNKVVEIELKFYKENISKKG